VHTSGKDGVLLFCAQVLEWKDSDTLLTVRDSFRSGLRT
jgi:hypothetical protein